MKHKIIEYDANLAPFEKDIDLRLERYEKKKKEGASEEELSLARYALAELINIQDEYYRGKCAECE